ncbi:spore germination protein [Alicyclobacillus mengziensis]|uniref:spore germination protein n=1 Tax=Alicyclobacillus mengziensis TaxID=2931921 RepID=UPI0024B36B9B|nr:spore germination protein [Alicyclobacillus mengziensis]
MKHITEQNVVMLVDGEMEAAALSAVSRRERAIEEPSTEAVIRGPKEAFNENIGTGIGLIRRRLPTPSFKMENLTIGSYTKTRVTFMSYAVAG